MRTKGTWACALLAGALILGCADQPLPTADTPAPAFSFMNNPKDGPVVFRFDQAWWALTWDAERGLSAWHGIDVTDFMFCPGGSSGLDPSVTQLVVPPHGEFFNEIDKADDHHVALYSTANPCDVLSCPFDLATFCANLTGPYLIGLGQVQFRQKSTEFKMLSWMFQGFITSWTDGSAIHYLEHQNGVWKDGSMVFNNNDIKLTPVPGR